MSRAKILIIIITVGALAGVFYSLKPSSDTQADTTEPSQQVASNGRRTLDITIAGGRLVSGQNTFTVQRNEVVTINAGADITDELHLHGYDVRFALQPGKTVTMTFTADKPGRFEAEMHSDKRSVFALEVQP